MTSRLALVILLSCTCFLFKEIMRERFRSGEWKAGDLIPSERELEEQYGVSRLTARQAIKELVNEGL
jgi:GntR family transcriptional regulator